MKTSYRRIGHELFSSITTAFSLLAVSHEAPHGLEPAISIEPFRYAPLTSASSFRILHLKRGSPERGSETDIRLCGSLVEASIDAPPEYYALSYIHLGRPRIVRNDQSRRKETCYHSQLCCRFAPYAARQIPEGDMGRLNLHQPGQFPGGPG